MRSLNKSFAGGSTLFYQSGENITLFSDDQDTISEGGSTVEMMRVKALDNDELYCHTWDGETEGTELIVVAKPWELRLSSWAGKTFNVYITDIATEKFLYTAIAGGRRTSTRLSDNDVEEQAIIPHYQWSADVDGVNAQGNVIPTMYPLDVIFVAKPINGTGLFDYGDVPVEYQDLNVAGRAWSEIAT
jgi:hypothetical protein